MIGFVKSLVLSIVLILLGFSVFNALTGFLVNKETPSIDDYNDLSINESDVLLFVKEVITRYVKDGEVVMLKHPPEWMTKPGRSFVTIKENGLLRGCIGDLSGQSSLHLSLVRSSINAAVNDARFVPLQPSELNNIEVEVNLINPPITYERKRSELPFFVKVGVHGLIMSKGSRSGVLLPSVPVEFGWDSKTFLEQTCDKAGLVRDCWKDEEVRVQYFTTRLIKEAPRAPGWDDSFEPNGPLTVKNVENTDSLRESLITSLGSVNVSVSGVRALITPHPGFTYGMKTMSYAFKALEGVSNTTFVVIGPSHYLRSPGVTPLLAREFKTRVSTSRINQGLTKKILESGFGNSYEAVHVQEHSLERPVIYASLVCSDCKVVPVIIGELNSKQIDEFVQLLMSEDVVLVVSADFSHYHSLGEALRLDAECFKHLLNLDEEGLLASYYSGECEVDTITSLIILLRYAKALGLKPALVYNETSYATTSDASNVVGYAAFNFYE